MPKSDRMVWAQLTLKKTREVICKGDSKETIFFFKWKQTNKQKLRFICLLVIKILAIDHAC